MDFASSNCTVLPGQGTFTCDGACGAFVKSAVTNGCFESLVDRIPGVTDGVRAA